VNSLYFGGATSAVLRRYENLKKLKISNRCRLTVANWAECRM